MVFWMDGKAGLYHIPFRLTNALVRWSLVIKRSIAGIVFIERHQSLTDKLALAAWKVGSP